MKKVKILLVFLLGCITLFSSAQKNGANSKLRAPAYPLIIIDPYTSVWSFGDKLNEDNTRHWTGERNSLTGAIRVDGKTYRFMGVDNIPYNSLLNVAKDEKWNASYVTTMPEINWISEDYNDSKWIKGKGAFGTPDMKNIGTVWQTENIWIRRSFELSESDLKDKLYLTYSHDDIFELYINGKQVVNTGLTWNNDVVLQLTPEMKKSLKSGNNVIAAHCNNTQGGGLVDFGILTEGDAERYMNEKAAQISVSAMPTQTYYSFYCGPVQLDLTFTNPLILDDLDLLARPVNYISYEVKSLDNSTHDVQVYLDGTPEWAVNTTDQPVVTEMYTKDGYTFLKTGTKSQKILGQAGDNMRIDWGYFYIAGKQNAQTSMAIGNNQLVRSNFVTTGKLLDKAGSVSSDLREDMPVLACVHNLGKIGPKSVSGYFMVGYDDIKSIQYFGQNLNPYWNRNGDQTIESMFTLADKNYRSVMNTCDKWDEKIMKEAYDAGGQKYAELCALSYRQAIGAHKLVEGPNKELYFFSKECFSNGSMGTVDITYPSAPIFVRYSLDLAKGMMNFIFDYVESGRWTKPFPPHDIGTYPLGNGQTYMDDMPVEEAGNMLITVAAVAVAEGNAKYAEKHWQTLTTWAEYLMEKGLDPENQLCTEDFAGYFAHNANLSVKAIVGIAGYGKLAEMLGKKDVAAKFTNEARKMAVEWEKMANDGDHYRLAFDQPNTYGQKYNMVWDKVLGLDIFPKEIAQKEIAYYLKKQNEYGTPLDNRFTWTINWMMIMSATLADNPIDFGKLVDPMWKFANETPNRHPMSDWHDTLEGNQINFRNRTVVGGVFIKMLDDYLKNKR